MDVPEAVLRLLLNETDIERAYAPPKGYDHNIQGEWNDELVTFKFRRSFELLDIEREGDYLSVEYKIESLGNWGIKIDTDNVSVVNL